MTHRASLKSKRRWCSLASLDFCKNTNNIPNTKVYEPLFLQNSAICDASSPILLILYFHKRELFDESIIRK